MKTIVAIAVALSLLSVSAVAQTADERRACMGDAFRVCSDAIPDRDRVAACMIKNKSQLGAPCRAVIARYRTETIKAAQDARHTIKAEAAHAEAN
jgi:hypothetical protein